MPTEPASRRNAPRHTTPPERERIIRAYARQIVKFKRIVQYLYAGSGILTGNRCTDVTGVFSIPKASAD